MPIVPRRRVNWGSAAVLLAWLQLQKTEVEPEKTLIESLKTLDKLLKEHEL